MHRPGILPCAMHFLGISRCIASPLDLETLSPSVPLVSMNRQIVLDLPCSA